MNTKHTPGPWTLCPATHSGIAISTAEDGEFKQPRAALAICGRNRSTAEGWHYIAAINDHKQAQSDARLIAAAPRILAALRAVADYWAGGDVPPELDAEIRAAIAEATGEGESEDFDEDDDRQILTKA